MNFVEIVLTLTVICADDSLGWTPSPDETRLIYGGGESITVPVGTSFFLLGCFEGTVRVTHVRNGEEGEPAFFWWEQVPGTLAIGADATGRFMEWDFPCPVDDFGECIKWGRAGKCRKNKPICPTIGGW